MRNFTVWQADIKHAFELKCNMQSKCVWVKWWRTQFEWQVSINHQPPWQWLVRAPSIANNRSHQISLRETPALHMHHIDMQLHMHHMTCSRPKQANNACIFMYAYACPCLYQSFKHTWIHVWHIHADSTMGNVTAQTFTLNSRVSYECHKHAHKHTTSQPIIMWPTLLCQVKLMTTILWHANSVIWVTSGLAVLLLTRYTHLQLILHTPHILCTWVF